MGRQSSIWNRSGVTWQHEWTEALTWDGGRNQKIQWISMEYYCIGFRGSTRESPDDIIEVSNSDEWDGGKTIAIVATWGKVIDVVEKYACSRCTKVYDQRLYLFKIDFLM